MKIINICDNNEPEKGPFHILYPFYELCLDINKRKIISECTKTTHLLSPRTRPEFIPPIPNKQCMNIEGPIPLCPCCKRPSLYRKQHSQTTYKCSYCHAVFPESCIEDYLSVEEPGMIVTEVVL
jgi:hypothetical protein